MRLVGTRVSGALLLLVAAVVFSLPAQASLPRDTTWTLEGGQAGYCIWYLADPDLARRMVPASAVLTPAGSGAGLPILLASTIREEPRFAEWIPGAICLGFYQRVSTGNRTLAEAKRDRPVIIATNTLAAQNARGVPGAAEYLLGFMTNNRSLANAADQIGVDMSGIEYGSRLRVEGGDPAVTITVDGTVISWSGHALSDSSVGKTRTMSFGYGGPRIADWLIRLETAPEVGRAIVGNLSVAGRSTLAKALLASPARAIGPLESGGNATLTFHAVTRQ